MAVGLVAAALAASSCATNRAGEGGRVSQLQADRYIERAVGQSNEGVVLIPSQSAEREFDRLRLAEIAQNMRRPLAVCFLERAIVTMEAGTIDGEPGWLDVPQGQAKFRARLNSSGAVLRVDVLDSGFEDPEMEACVVDVVQGTSFPESRSQTPQWVDVVYWVSLGLYQDARSPEFRMHMRREQAEAAVAGKRCLEGTVSPGTYEVRGLSLFDREGGTLVNRVERGELDAEVSRCLAQAFKQIRIPAEREAFVRPAAPVVTFEVSADGAVSFGDERWLELIHKEERALREAKRASSSPTDDEEPGPIDPERDAVSGLVPLVDEAPGLDDEKQGPRKEAPAKTVDDADGPPAKPAEKTRERAEPKDEAPREDPAKGGLKLDLGSRGRGGG